MQEKLAVDKEKIQALQNILARPGRIGIFSHVNPDGDAIGSALAVYHYLKNAGRDAVVVIPNQVPRFLQWLPGAEDIFVFEENQEEGKKRIAQLDLLLAVDFNSLSRLSAVGEFFLARQVPKVLIDHHPQPEAFTDLTITDTRVSSTAEMLYNILLALAPQALTHDIALNLYTGIVTDTGSFSYNSSRPQTFYIVGKLLAFGFNKDEVNGKLFDNFRPSRMQLMGYSLHKKMKVFPQYHTAYIALSMADMKKYNYQPGDTEGFVNLPMSIRGVFFSVLFLEKDKLIKLSLRSKGQFDVNALARAHFKGGGHVNAAGGKSQRSLQETVTLFEALLPHIKQDLDENAVFLNAPQPEPEK